MLNALVERELSDDTRLRRTVAFFQRELGEIFGNAQAQRRNRRYEIQIAVYEKPIPGSGRAYRMPEKQIRSWVKVAADRSHPRLYRRVRVDVEPWKVGHATNKAYCPVLVSVDATQREQTT